MLWGGLYLPNLNMGICVGLNQNVDISKIKSSKVFPSQYDCNALQMTVQRPKIFFTAHLWVLSFYNHFWHLDYLVRQTNPCKLIIWSNNVASGLFGRLLAEKFTTNALVSHPQESHMSVKWMRIMLRQGKKVRNCFSNLLSFAWCR